MIIRAFDDVNMFNIDQRFDVIRDGEKRDTHLFVYDNRYGI